MEQLHIKMDNPENQTDSLAVEETIERPAADGHKNVVAPKTTISRGLIGVCKVAAKHFPLVMGVYLMGYFNFSLAWIIGLVGVTAATTQWKKERDYRMGAHRAAAMFDEKEVILARVTDLPSWVRIHYYSYSPVLITIFLFSLGLFPRL